MNQARIISAADMQKIHELADSCSGQKWALIPLLHKIQESVGYIPQESVPYIADKLGLFSSQVQGVITFYSQLYTEPRGGKVVRVCRGTACHVRGGKTVLKLVKGQLGIDEGETTEDLKYTLETVACIGVCALAPNITVGNQVHGNMNPKKLERIFGKKSK